MILAWLLHRRTRQATRRSSFSRRKPVVVATAPAAPRPNQGERGRVAFGAAQLATDGCRRGRFAQRDGSLTSARRMRFAAARDRLLRVRLTNEEAEQVRAGLKHEG